MIHIFGLSKNTLLKRDIIEVLDRTQEPISYKELQMDIPYVSSSTLKATCAELAELLEQLYPDKNCFLQFSKEKKTISISLVRSSNNLQFFYDYIYSDDLAHDILQVLLLRRKFSTIEFCHAHGVSESKLKRKIKDINRELRSFDLYISCSNQLNLKGREVNIRAFHYILLRIVHRQFFTIPESAYLHETYQLGKYIADYLGVPNDLPLIERFAYWVLITRTGLFKGEELQFSAKEEQLISNLVFPEKPVFLARWSEQDWQFLLIAIHCSISDYFRLETKDENLAKTDSQERWIELFQYYFRPLTIEEKRLAFEKLQQLDLTTYFFPLSTNFLLVLKEFIGLEDLAVMYPRYIQQFDCFWQDWSMQFPDRNSEMFRMFSLLTSVTILPMEELLPEVAVYAFSENNDAFKQYIKIKITFSFSNRYHLTFVDSPQKADLLIGTTNFYENDASPHQKYLIVRTRVYQRDLDDISNALEAIIDRRLVESSQY
ncbi:helix-turn-helix domain-containing protein [Enterococcus sp. AZ072]|uniref:helix-turn-helix domain-containing protein n=1 Tax=unclassified Enterococcus TaxID=2608891 RepID=UPI003D295A86